MGKLIEVEIVECGKYSMIGKILTNLDELAKVPIKQRRTELTNLNKVIKKFYKIIQAIN